MDETLNITHVLMGVAYGMAGQWVREDLSRQIQHEITRIAVAKFGFGLVKGDP